MSEMIHLVDQLISSHLVDAVLVRETDSTYAAISNFVL